jgi:transcriptional regulator with XRE-family HTH domain
VKYYIEALKAPEGLINMRTVLVAHRTEKGYTQKEVANFLGISRRMYGSIETGDRNPSWKVQIALEQFYGVPIRELLADEDSEDPASSTSKL